MSHDPDAGLVKRGFALLVVIGLLVTVVLFILFQRPEPPAPESTKAERYLWSVAVPTAAGYPGCVSWGALHQLNDLLPSPVGWEVRHNAAATLARRGSDQVPWYLFREMLDEERQVRNCRAQIEDVSQEAPEAAARGIVRVALKALAEWHQKRREAGRSEAPSELLPVYEMVDRLAESPSPDLREEAQKTRQTFFRG